MKNNKLLLTILFASLLFMSGCTGCNRVAPNHEGVLMTSYGRNGESDFKLVTGSQGWLGWGSELYTVPMWEQKADPPQLTVIARDGGAFTVDPNFTYQSIRGKGVKIIFNYKHVGTTKEMMDNIEAQILNPLVLNAYREEARNFTTDSLLNNLNSFEQKVEFRLKTEFDAKYFQLNTLSSGLRPPASMIAAIERRNNTIQESERVKNELEVSKMNLEKARIDAERDRIQSAGLTKEILQQQWIEALRNSSNKVIVTDGRTPIILNP